MRESTTNNSLPILIVGLPRSGTTWIGEVLSSARGIDYAFEPDNEKRSALAWLGKDRMHRFPYVTAHDEAPEYEAMWRAILYGRPEIRLANRALRPFLKRNAPRLEALLGQKSGHSYLDSSMRTLGSVQSFQATRPYTKESHPFVAFWAQRLLRAGQREGGRGRVIAKSVHAALSLDWLSACLPARIILVLRNPYSLFASYKRMRMPDANRNIILQPTLQRDLPHLMPDTSAVLMPEPEDAIAFQIMMMYKVLEKQIRTHPEWILISHDRLCVEPQLRYKQLFDDLGLDWSERTRKHIDALNREGSEFNPRRISSQEPSKWKKEMAEKEQGIIRGWTDRFELQDFFDTFVNLSQP